MRDLKFAWGKLFSNFQTWVFFYNIFPHYPVWQMILFSAVPMQKKSGFYVVISEFENFF